MPEAIGKDYVDGVLDGLYEAEGEAARIIVKEGEIVPSAAALLRAVYTGEALTYRLQVWGTAIRERFDGLRNPPGELLVSADEVQTATSQCIFVRVLSDYRPRSSLAQLPVMDYLALVQKLPENDPGGSNPTPWVIFQ